VPIVLKSGSLNLLEAAGPVKAFNGNALPFFLPPRKLLLISSLTFSRLYQNCCLLICDIVYSGGRLPAISKVMRLSTSGQIYPSSPSITSLENLNYQTIFSQFSKRNLSNEIEADTRPQKERERERGGGEREGQTGRINSIKDVLLFAL
jgi:hypothetical protein